MIELLCGVVFVGYAVAGLVYSVLMENDRALKQVHKIKSDHDWSERCVAFGFFWPVAPLVNYIIRRKNDPR